MIGEAAALRDLQRWFAIAITHPCGALAGAAEASRTLGLSDGAPESCVTPGPVLGAAERLQIYCDSYFARLVECLVDDYPALKFALGEAEFERLARAYIQQYPSRSPSLNAYGQRLATFCRRRAEPWAPFAAELARLEWSIVELVHAPAAARLPPDSLAAIPPERFQFLRFQASPALSVLEFDYPINEFYQAFRDGAVPVLPARQRSATAVYRYGLEIWRLYIDPTAAWLLRDLVHGVPLGSAIERLERRVSDPIELRALGDKLQRWLGSWVTSGLFTAIDWE